MSTKNIADLRRDYTLKSLDVADVNPNPMDQFQVWLDEALQAQIPEPNAMHVATVSPQGHPTIRVLLLKGLSKDGFEFYTNYQSRKGQELAQNPWACLSFCWLELERQVRIEGQVEKLSPETSTVYFHSRPRESQLGAWTSEQSKVIPDRAYLENKYKTLEEHYQGQEIPRPEHWGGYRLIPTLIEFWQGRSSRLHDRLVYTLQGNQWQIDRLSP